TNIIPTLALAEVGQAAHVGGDAAGEVARGAGAKVRPLGSRGLGPVLCLRGDESGAVSLDAQEPRDGLGPVEPAGPVPDLGPVIAFVVPSGEPEPVPKAPGPDARLLGEGLDRRQAEAPVIPHQPAGEGERPGRVDGLAEEDAQVVAAGAVGSRE